MTRARSGFVWLDDNERQAVMGKRKTVEGDASAMVEMRGESGVADDATATDDVEHIGTIHGLDGLDAFADAVRNGTDVPGPSAADVKEALDGMPPRPEFARQELVTLECGHCGGDAITATMFSDGDGSALGCVECGFPGHVSIDDDAAGDEPPMPTADWVLSEDDGAKCNRPDCVECVPQPIRIAMTERRPVEIHEADWPIIGGHSVRDGTFIEVRQHKDGRRIVHGKRGKEASGSCRAYAAGYVVPLASVPAQMDRDTVSAIRGVAQELGATLMFAGEVVASMPAERL